MIENAVKELKQRQQTIAEQIQSLQAETDKLEKAISVLGTLGLDNVGEAPAAKAPKAPKAKKRTMSAAGRRAVGEAAKARWAKIRAAKEGKAVPATKAKAEPATKKRKMSAAGRKAIAAAAKARWAALRAKKAGKAAPAEPKAAKAATAEPQNKIPLMDVVLKVLHPEKAQSIPEIITAVNKAGYESDSKNFATIIGQTLKKAGEKVIRVRRGMYALNG